VQKDANFLEIHFYTPLGNHLVNTNKKLLHKTLTLYSFVRMQLQ